MIRELLVLPPLIVGAMLTVSAWVTAVKYDWRRDEPLLVVAWVACPPCGVARGAYVYFVN
jgi:hypothetical protein